MKECPIGLWPSAEHHKMCTRNHQSSSSAAVPEIVSVQALWGNLRSFPIEPHLPAQGHGESW
jgi:hypothetical protein